MNKHPHPCPSPKNGALSSLLAAPCIVGLACALILFSDGCMYKASTASTPATVNVDITSVIAAAGAAANQAEQAYQNKTIAQTPAARNAINTLGAAYEQARLAYGAVLEAEQIYRQAEAMQVSSCVPSLASASPGSAANCQATGQSAAAAQTKLQTAQAGLNAKIANLANQTKAVQALK